MTEGLDALIDDLAAEHAALDAAVALLDPAGWDRPTPADGWRIRDQIGHLTYFDAQAVSAATDPDGFERGRDAAIADLAAFQRDAERLGRELGANELLATWRAGRTELLAAFTGADPSRRLPWYGPPMSARSFLTARLMETWAHGQDVRDALGLAPEATARLHHVAHLGVVTRGWSYAVRGLVAPDVEVGVTLEPPAGGPLWTWSTDDAPEHIEGPALDFCLVVTQRRHVDDTALVATGAAAVEWLRIAQCFAGGPAAGRQPGAVRGSRPA